MKKLHILLLPAFVLLFQAARADIVLDSLWRVNFDTTSVLKAKFTPNGQYIAVAHGFYDGPFTHKGVVIKPWLINRATGQKVREFTGLYSNSVESLDISPDGTLLAAGGETIDSIAALCIWDISTGTLQRTLLSNDANVSHKFNRIWNVVFSRDGKYIFVCIDSLGVREGLDSNHHRIYFTPYHLFVINTQTWQLERNNENNAGKPLITSPDNRFYAIIRPEHVFLYNLTNDTLMHSFISRTGEISSIDISPDSTTIAVAENYYIYLYNLSDFTLRDSIATNIRSVDPIKFFPNSKYLFYRYAVANMPGIFIVDILTKETLFQSTKTGDPEISWDSKYFQKIKRKSIEIDTIKYTETRVEDPGQPHKEINVLYPNPTDGSINIKINEGNIEEMKFEIFGSNGNKVSDVSQADIQAGIGNILHYNAHKLGSGVYFFKISGPGNTETYKIIIRK